MLKPGKPLTSDNKLKRGKPLTKTSQKISVKKRSIKRITVKTANYNDEFNEARKIVIERDKGLCVRCRFHGNHVHHILPRSLGGSNDLSNLVLLCMECHEWVHAGNTSVWLQSKSDTGHTTTT